MKKIILLLCELALIVNPLFAQVYSPLTKPKNGNRIIDIGHKNPEYETRNSPKIWREYIGIVNTFQSINMYGRSKSDKEECVTDQYGVENCPLLKEKCDSKKENIEGFSNLISRSTTTPAVCPQETSWVNANSRCEVNLYCPSGYVVNVGSDQCSKAEWIKTHEWPAFSFSTTYEGHNINMHGWSFSQANEGVLYVPSITGSPAFPTTYNFTGFSRGYRGFFTAQGIDTGTVRVVATITKEYVHDRASNVSVTAGYREEFRVSTDPGSCPAGTVKDGSKCVADSFCPSGYTKTNGTTCTQNYSYYRYSCPVGAPTSSYPAENGIHYTYYAGTVDGYNASYYPAIVDTLEEQYPAFERTASYAYPAFTAKGNEVIYDALIKNVESQYAANIGVSETTYDADAVTETSSYSATPTPSVKTYDSSTTSTSSFYGATATQEQNTYDAYVTKYSEDYDALVTTNSNAYDADYSQTTNVYAATIHKDAVAYEPTLIEKVTSYDANVIPKSSTYNAELTSTSTAYSATVSQSLSSYPATPKSSNVNYNATPETLTTTYAVDYTPVATDWFDKSSVACPVGTEYNPTTNKCTYSSTAQCGALWDQTNFNTISSGTINVSAYANIATGYSGITWNSACEIISAETQGNVFTLSVAPGSSAVLNGLEVKNTSSGVRSCSSGGTLNGNVCEFDPKCPSYAESDEGTKCVTYKPTEVCNEGDQLVDGLCQHHEVVYSCNDADAISGSVCTKAVIALECQQGDEIQADGTCIHKNLSYSCPSGDVLEGTNCVNTANIYTCNQGDTLNGTECTNNYNEYACEAGDQLLGTLCLNTATSLACNDGDTLSGDMCMHAPSSYLATVNNATSTYDAIATPATNTYDATATVYTNTYDATLNNATSTYNATATVTTTTYPATSSPIVTTYAASEGTIDVPYELYSSVGCEKYPGSYYDAATKRCLINRTTCPSGSSQGGDGYCYANPGQCYAKVYFSYYNVNDGWSYSTTYTMNPGDTLTDVFGTKNNAYANASLNSQCTVTMNMGYWPWHGWNWQATSLPAGSSNGLGRKWNDWTQEGMYMYNSGKYKQCPSGFYYSASIDKCKMYQSCPSGYYSYNGNQCYQPLDCPDYAPTKKYDSALGRLMCYAKESALVCADGDVLNGTTCTHTQPAYVCNDGDTLSGTTCTNSVTNYSCAAGDSLSGTACIHPYTYYSCAAGDLLSDATCTHSSTSYTCSGNDTINGLQCIHDYTVYSCNTGDTLDGTMCTHPYTYLTCQSQDDLLDGSTCYDKKSLYSCAAGDKLDPETGSCEHIDNTYTCSSGDVLNGTKCVNTTYDYTCVDGDTQFGTTCRHTWDEYSCDAGDKLDGVQCQHDALVYSCSDQDTLIREDECEHAETLYSCNAGDTLNDDHSCTTNYVKYICDDGDALNGSTCTHEESTYSCSEYDSLNETTCTHRVTEYKCLSDDDVLDGVICTANNETSICDEGDDVNGTKCIGHSTSYSCEGVDVLSGTMCSRIFPEYYCNVGDVLADKQCNTFVDTQSCLDGDLLAPDGQCKHEEPNVVCAAGDVVVGNNCAHQESGYYCKAGYQLSGTTCDALASTLLLDIRGPVDPGNDCNGLCPGGRSEGCVCNSPTPLPSNCYYSADSCPFDESKPCTIDGPGAIVQKPLEIHKVAGNGLTPAAFGEYETHECGENCPYGLTNIHGEGNLLCFGKPNGAGKCQYVEGCDFNGSIYADNGKMLTYVASDYATNTIYAGDQDGKIYTDRIQSSCLVNGSVGYSKRTDPIVSLVVDADKLKFWNQFGEGGYLGFLEFTRDVYQVDKDEGYVLDYDKAWQIRSAGFNRVEGTLERTYAFSQEEMGLQECQEKAAELGMYVFNPIAPMSVGDAERDVYEIIYGATGGYYNQNTQYDTVSVPGWCEEGWTLNQSTYLCEQEQPVVRVCQVHYDAGGNDCANGKGTCYGFSETACTTSSTDPSCPIDTDSTVAFLDPATLEITYKNPRGLGGKSIYFDANCNANAGWWSGVVRNTCLQGAEYDSLKDKCIATTIVSCPAGTLSVTGATCHAPQAGKRQCVIAKDGLAIPSCDAATDPSCDPSTVNWSYSRLYGFSDARWAVKTSENSTEESFCSPLSCEGDHLCQLAACQNGTDGSLISSNLREPEVGECTEQYCDAKKPYYPSCGIYAPCPIDQPGVVNIDGSCMKVECPEGGFDEKTGKCYKFQCPDGYSEIGGKCVK